MDKITIFLDNGAHTVKAGISKENSTAEEAPRVIPNAIIRSKGDKVNYVGHEFERCKDYASIHYRLPIEKGFIVDWDAQKAIWDGIFSDEVFSIDTTQSTLLITEPYFNLPNIQEVYDQFVFEEYEFDSYYRCTPASVIPHGTLFSAPGLPNPACSLVIDSGFSFTHVIPILNGRVVWKAVKRLDVGGKLLTNQLKELVSFRQWNMMDETYIMNHIKETCCYVSADFKAELEKFHAHPDLKTSPIIQEYVLPDLSRQRYGHIKKPDDIVADSDQILVMNNERFSVPELMFRPDDIGLNQSGIAATVALSISLLPEDLQGMFWANIGLIGGNTKFPGFKSRLMSELTTIAPTKHEVVLYSREEPTLEAYFAATRFANTPEFREVVVTRAEYTEAGSNATRRKFTDWKDEAEDHDFPIRSGDAPRPTTARDRASSARDKDPKFNPNSTTQPKAGRPRREKSQSGDVQVQPGSQAQGQHGYDDHDQPTTPRRRRSRATAPDGLDGRAAAARTSVRGDSRRR